MAYLDEPRLPSTYIPQVVTFEAAKPVKHRTDHVASKLATIVFYSISP